MIALTWRPIEGTPLLRADYGWVTFFAGAKGLLVEEAGDSHMFTCASQDAAMLRASEWLAARANEGALSRCVVAIDKIAEAKGLELYLIVRRTHFERSGAYVAQVGYGPLLSATAPTVEGAVGELVARIVREP